MKFLVTGATGFLGEYVVAEALRAGHSVRAVVRSTASAEKLGWRESDRLEFARVDLRSRKGLVDAVRGADCVLHLAAQKAGDIYAQFHGTVVTTENLLWAMIEAGVKHIVHVSTFSVYDYYHLPARTLIDENTPLERTPADRDEYAQTKLVQEQIVVDAAKANGWRYTVLRPGVIYGRDNLFNSRLGIKAGEKLWIRTGAWARLPLNYVENCAEAIVMSAENERANGEVFNVVDDDLPRQRSYLNLLRSRTQPRPRVLPVSWTMMRLVAGTAAWTNRVFFKNRAKIPGLFSPSKMHARLKPMHFTNAKIKRVLGWKPKYGLNAAFDRSLGHNWIEPVNVDYDLPQLPAPSSHTIEVDVTRVAS